MPSFQDLIKTVKSQVTEISPDDASKKMKTNPEAAIIDVREPDEWEGGIIPRAGL